ncbi:hypothetical protein L6452_19011 [Arctium lappa]|uniref:Uncharacterized protein n=1 Tax=Arctium lappa TaxID=4217 RepID=A0ACB9B993_ARCLA|nr:hypothetical protein L6452_19011 [Arctium lappa]
MIESQNMYLSKMVQTAKDFPQPFFTVSTTSESTRCPLESVPQKMALYHQHYVLQRWKLLYIAFLEKEIIWENGQPTMHGLGRANETLESIVHQATTCYNQSQNQEIDLQQSRSLPRSCNLSSNVASSHAKWGDSAGQSYLMKPPQSSAVFHDQCENQEEECRTENKTVRSQSSRRSRAVAIQNQTERSVELERLAVFLDSDISLWRIAKPLEDLQPFE